jgi:hypothetical protein
MRAAWAPAVKVVDMHAGATSAHAVRTNCTSAYEAALLLRDALVAPG